ncbi:MAG: aromatic acid decarboxylase [Deltaproteobacteria bacterium]|nr:MAG: aromatic acid decarboxylase [Deltaproteobacteria bacterium]HDO80585.1 UbiX family flavin prenyltransferase [Candidatus Bathyarchaeota archaeon]
MLNDGTLIIGMTGASGAIYGIRALEVLKKLGVETCLVITKTGEKIIEYETKYSVTDVKRLSTYWYDVNNLSAPIASGSFPTRGMVIIPCSMKTLAGVANGYSDNLLLRAADVTLKEGRPLILVLRETPLNVIHLRNMLKLAEMNVRILPASPSFYYKPRKVDDLVNYVVGKALELLGIKHGLYKAWNDFSGVQVDDMENRQ